MDRVLHRNAAFALAGLFLFAIWGFWPNYFSHPLTQANWRFHFHGITLISWFGLMISQAYLIRTNRRRVHRQVGKVSFILAPLVVISTLVLAHYRLRPTELTDATLYFLLLPIALLLQFLLAYGLAIYHRRNPPLHARFMICTALPMMPAIFDRIMSFYVLLAYASAVFTSDWWRAAVLVDLVGHGRRYLDTLSDLGLEVAQAFECIPGRIGGVHHS